MKKLFCILVLLLISVTCTAPKKQDKTVATNPPLKPAPAKEIKLPQPHDDPKPPPDQIKKSIYTLFTVKKDWEKSAALRHVCRGAGYYLYPFVQQHTNWYELKYVRYLGNGRVEKGLGIVIQEGALSREICAEVKAN